jgi:hypothetical protein
LKWLNVGVAELFDEVYVDGRGTVVADSPYTRTSHRIEVNDGIGWHTVKLLKHVNPTKELWFSYDAAMDASESVPFFQAKGGDVSIRITLSNENGIYLKANVNGVEVKSADTVQLETNVLTNFEIHLKMGEQGRIDVWKDTKLIWSYRSPSAFPDVAIDTVGLQSGEYHGRDLRLSSFIYQDTRRIGLERFKMLTIDPATEQNMPQGSTTTYTLSGLSDSTEFADITSVGAILQATSRDANITEGTFSIEGATLGTIDVSDSSGKAFEIAHAELNALTGKPWTRDDIEGKTLSFTVNGAS